MQCCNLTFQPLKKVKSDAANNHCLKTGGRVQTTPTLGGGAATEILLANKRIVNEECLFLIALTLSCVVEGLQKRLGVVVGALELALLLEELLLTRHSPYKDNEV